MGIRADLEARPVLALVHVGVHVSHDREGDLAGRVLEDRHRADVDHLVHRGRQGDRCPGHARDARAPDAAGDDDDVGPDVALVGAHAGHATLDDVEPGHLRLRRDRQRADVDRRLAHERAGLQRVDDPDPRRVEAGQDLRLVDEGHHRLDLVGRDEPHALDAPRPGSRHAALELFDPLRRSGDLDAAALGEDAELLVLPDAVEREGGHLLGVIGQEDEVRRVPRRATRARQRAFLDEHDVAPTEAGQVVGHAVAHDARADDDDPRSIGKRCHVRWTSS